MAQKTVWSRLRSSAPYLAIVALGILALANRHAYLEVRDRPAGPEGVTPLSQIQEIYPEAAKVTDCDSPGQPCRLLGDAGDLIAKVIFSAGYVDDITGYGGPVSLAIELDDAETIRTVAVLDHDETPSFVEDVSEAELLSSWAGLSLEEAVANDVDVVTGATLTSRAIIDTVQVTVSHYVDDKAVTADMDGADMALFAPQILTLVFLAPGVIGALSKGFRRRFQTPKLLANVIVLGFVARSLLSLSLFQGMILHGVDLASSWHLLVVLSAFAVVSIVKGTNVWCAHICPYGSFQGLVAKAGKGARLKLPDRARKVLRHTRPLILAGAFVAAYLSPGIDLARVEPFAAFVLVGVPASALVIAVVFLVLSLVQPKLWCRSFCPTGMLLDTLRIRERH